MYTHKIAHGTLLSIRSLLYTLEHCTRAAGHEAQLGLNDDADLSAPYIMNVIWTQADGIESTKGIEDDKAGRASITFPAGRQLAFCQSLRTHFCDEALVGV